MTHTITQLVNQIATEIDSATMSQDPSDYQRFRTAGEQQACEQAQEMVRIKARATLRLTWEWERERAERANSPFRAAVARAWLADLEEVA